MSIYIINLLGISFLWFVLFIIKKENTDKGKKIFITLIGVQLIFLQGLRAKSVGTDTSTYLLVYNWMKNMNWQESLNQRFELGYKLLNKLFAMLGFNDQLFLFGISALIIIPVCIFIYKNSSNVYLSIYFYITFGFYATSFNTLRQNLAYGLILISFSFIKKRRLIPFILIVILAASFHISALVFLPAYYLARIRLTKRSFIIICLSILMIMVFKNQIMVYVISNIFESYSISHTNAYSWLLFNAFLFIGIMLFYPINREVDSNYIEKNNTNKRDKEERVSTENTVIRMLYMLTLIGIVLMLFATIANNVMRISSYYHIFIILLIPVALKKVKNIYLREILTIVLFIGMGMVYIYFLNTPSDHNYVPYKFYWN